MTVTQKRYEKFANQTKSLSIFDRSIFESIIFARKNLSAQSFKYFYKFWLAEIKELIKAYGKPKLYILLEINWKTFQQRFFNRGHKVETKYFEENKKFFQSHVEEYIDLMISILKKFKINFKVINTNDLELDEVVEKVTSKIKNIDF